MMSGARNGKVAPADHASKPNSNGVQKNKAGKM